MERVARCIAIGYQSFADSLNVLLNFSILIDGNLRVQAAEKRFAKLFFFGGRNQGAGRVAHVRQFDFGNLNGLRWGREEGEA